MKVYYRERVEIGRHVLYCGDSLDLLPSLRERGEIDAVVCDPPYGLEFMGHGWDKLGASSEHRTDRAGEMVSENKRRFIASGVTYGRDAKQMQEWHRAWAAAALELALPGSPLLAFGGTRTAHRLTCGIEDAGWEIRDTLGYLYGPLLWGYGSGFPKSLDVSNAIDELAFTDWLDDHPDEATKYRKQIEQANGDTDAIEHVRRKFRAAAATDAAKLWTGYGTALKPAYEPIALAMKANAGTFADNARAHGVAGLNIDGCRIGHMSEAETKRSGQSTESTIGATGLAPESWADRDPAGRWPANLIHDGSDEAIAGFPLLPYMHNAEPIRRSAGRRSGFSAGVKGEGYRHDSPKSAARFFYVAKASRSERERGCGGLPEFDAAKYAQDEWSRDKYGRHKARNFHPTVKPLALMVYLVRLVTAPKPRYLLDPFLGSGTTALACEQYGRACIGIERDPRYFRIAVKRLQAAVSQRKLF